MSILFSRFTLGDHIKIILNYILIGEKTSLSDSKKSVHQPLSVLDNSTTALDPNLVGLRQGVRYMTNGLKARNRRDMNIMISL